LWKSVLVHDAPDLSVHVGDILDARGNARNLGIVQSFDLAVFYRALTVEYAHKLCVGNIALVVERINTVIVLVPQFRFVSTAGTTWEAIEYGSIPH
jgi:hypothetical protein